MIVDQARGRRGSRGRLVRRVAFAYFVLLGVLVASSVFAQTRRDGRLLVTVADETGAVIPGASVTVAGQETATRTATPPQVRTSDQGIAAIAGLAPGRYMIQAEFPGFAPQAIRDVRVRTGDNKQSITLSIGKLQTEVTVGRDVQESKVDSRGLTFGSALTREQIDALSDDPNEMRRQLADMAGPGSVIRVDSFEGGDLPPKSQIKSIHVTIS